MDLKFESSHVENTANCDINKTNENSAANAANSEHELTFLQALRYYRTAVMWSILVSTATVMESYDLQLINSFFAYPEFQKKYGVRLPNGSYSIPAKWQLGLSLGSNIGLCIGVFLNGWLTECFGPRKVMLGCYIILSGFIFATFFSPTVEVLLVSQILCGLPWGIFAALTLSYAVEVCPMVLRSYLTTFVNLFWVIGHIIATGVLQGLINKHTEWAFHIPFALQWMWPLPLFVIIWFAPDSPWWLVRRNRVQEAEATMKRLISAPEESINPKDIVAMIVHTINTEKEMNIGTTYAQCFQGNSRRRTEIAMVSWGGQLLVDFAIQNYTTYFFTLAGLATDDAFKLSLGMYSTAFLGTVFSWFFQAYFGRRRMYLTGLSVMLPIMALVGFLDLAPASTNIRWTQSTVLLVWFACYGLSIGPLPYAIASEVPSSRLRIKTTSLGRNSYYLLSCVNIVAAPYLLNPSEANLRGKAAFPAAFFTLLLLVWAWFRLPETKGRTFEELDILFERQVPTRQFTTHDTNLVD